MALPDNGVSLLLWHSAVPCISDQSKMLVPALSILYWLHHQVLYADPQIVANKLDSGANAQQ